MAADRIPQMVSLHELKSKFGLSTGTVRREELAGHFPKRIRIASRRVAWREADIIAWLAQREGQRNG